MAAHLGTVYIEEKRKYPSVSIDLIRSRYVLSEEGIDIINGFFRDYIRVNRGRLFATYKRAISYGAGKNYVWISRIMKDSLKGFVDKLVDLVDRHAVPYELS